MESVQEGFRCVTVDQVAKHIVEGNCLYLSTVDLAHADRSVMIRP